MFEKAKNFTLRRPRLKKTVGGFFVFVGFVALVTPLTPGAFLLVVGLELLGLRFMFLDRIMPKKWQTKPAEVALVTPAVG